MGIKPDESPRDRQSLRLELGMDGKQIILFVGELSARKNQTFLIELMPSIRAEFPNAELWLIGDGDRYGEQRTLVASLGLEDCVYHLGRREDARNFTAACDLYISASHIEGLPFNIVEALMLGAPTVASDIKGHRDILADGAGILFAPGDKSDALNKIIPILKGDANISKKACDAAVLRYRFSEVFTDTLDKITTENERK
jgi:glycosyltransferase EpsD